VSASPAPNATVAGPVRVELRFSEALMPKFSGADLTMTGHGGTTHAPVQIPVVAGIVGDGHTLVVTPRAPLGAGRYSVAWHVVSTDTHRIAGDFAFTVK
jgi:methionine-rich copper-binding protein CopC